jgi:serine/threonine protein kinase
MIRARSKEPASIGSRVRMSPPTDPLLGKVLGGKWRVESLLGEGGMASVYAAKHRNGLRGAIKLLKPHLVDSKELQRRLVREGYVANHVEHPGVVRVLDDDITEDGRAYLVLELLEGETWKSAWHKRGRRLPAAEVLETAEKVADILRAAHAAGVVHRDVKPDNVFLTSDGEVKLLDFGIARLREADAFHTQTGTMLGTPAFMSPEQALAKWSDVDARSDLFSLGASMWTLMTGRLLHVADTVPELLVAAATKQVVSFASVAPNASAEIVAVVDRALAFKPSDRFQDAAEMLAALSRARAVIGGGTFVAAPSDDALRFLGQSGGTVPIEAPNALPSSTVKMDRPAAKDAKPSEPIGEVTDAPPTIVTPEASAEPGPEPELGRPLDAAPPGGGANADTNPS